jgi:hypothetical protein
MLCKSKKLAKIRENNKWLLLSSSEYIEVMKAKQLPLRGHG